MLGFIIGTFVGLFSGALTNSAATRRLALGELWASILSGVVVTAVGSVAYTVLRVHEWLAGPGASWGLSVFLAVCMGITHGVLFRDRPLAPRA
jgi:uncharacterized transporter YbjL